MLKWSIRTLEKCVAFLKQQDDKRDIITPDIPEITTTPLKEYRKVDYLYKKNTFIAPCDLDYDNPNKIAHALSAGVSFEVPHVDKDEHNITFLVPISGELFKHYTFFSCLDFDNLYDDLINQQTELPWSIQSYNDVVSIVFYSDEALIYVYRDIHTRKFMMCSLDKKRDLAYSSLNFIPGNIFLEDYEHCSLGSTIFDLVNSVEITSSTQLLDFMERVGFEVRELRNILQLSRPYAYYTIAERAKLAAYKLTPPVVQ